MHETNIEAPIERNWYKVQKQSFNKLEIVYYNQTRSLRHLIAHYLLRELLFQNKNLFVIASSIN